MTCVIFLLQALERRTSQTDNAENISPPDATTSSLRTKGEYTAVSSGNAFNPQISVILNGNYYHDDAEGRGEEILREASQSSQTHDHEEGETHSRGDTDNGFNLREAEIAFSATVDPFFDATVYLTIDGNSNLELEEAWFQTRRLLYGLKLKGRKFLSDFGYINNQHPHQ